ncbi:MAG: hypothetical protein NTX97_12330 [Bacteroidetes bacterium]|nr:hypothetical protein [Bacteroidota bacterium]
MDRVLFRILTGRVLGKIDLATGVCTQVGNLGSNFSSLTFDGSGQLYGATGNGATPPETLFKIDKTTAATTLMYAMGSGADGEVLCYNRADDFIYHWSGNGTMVMEKMARTDVAYTPINIVTTGLSSGETFGALYLSPTNFIISNISSQFKRLSASGDYGAVLASLPDDLRGIVMPPQFTNSTTTICQGETFYIGAGSLQLFDSVTYYWGDGTHSAIAITNMGLDGASHIYSSAGTFDVHILLDNGFVRDTISQLNVTVNPTPVVAISGSAALCPLASNTFTVSGTGILQWYYNGTILAGETTNSYTTNVLGVYNLTETNSFGCSDSAAIGLTLINVPNPTVTANSTAPAICSGAPVTLTGGGASTYVWDNSVTDGVVFNPTASTTYNVIGTDVNGCTNTASIAVTVNVLPTVTANSSAAAICIGDIVTLTGGGAATYIWDNSVLDNVAFAPTDTTMYTVLGTDINGCTNTSSVTVIVNTLPIVTITGATSICNGSNTTLTANGASTYAWTGGPSTAGYTVAPSTNITYTVTATDLNGCINTATVLVTVNTVNVATLHV